MTLFKPDSGDQSDAYRNLRDADWNAPLRAFAEQLWEKFGAHAEPAFIDELSRAFHQRFWEMYVGCGLLNVGLIPEPKPPAGPDFKIQTDRVIWIEATVPMAGTGADAVPDFASGEAQKVPVEKILLRLRGAIEDKHRKYLGYLEKGIASPDDCFVIAVNGGLIPHSILESDPPRIVSALFPLGERFVTIDRNTVEVIDAGFRYRGQVTKHSGSEVPTTLFTSDDYRYISAVLYSNSDAGNHPPAVSNVGSDFIVIYNPFARNPIPGGVLPSGREYVVENEHLVCRTAEAQRVV
ncbi:hypothetical protein [Litchfieldella qijiaojingensis]|nr:hypothetical protein [Halomonas qijiaojingensis]